MFKFLVSALVLVTLTRPASAQNLDRLPGRAQQLLTLRSTVNIDKPKAVQFIAQQDRQDFLESNPLPMMDAKVTGLEFTNDPKVVYVTFTAKVMLPDIGPVPRNGKEPWIWVKNNWFLRSDDSGDFLTLARNAPTKIETKPLPLALSTSHIDLGKLVQGQVVKGSLEIKSDRDEIRVFRPPDFPGLTMTSPRWESQEKGRVDFVFDTTLMFEDVHYKGELAVEGYEAQHSSAALELSAQIEPRLKITQTPALLDPFRDGSVEVSIQNASKIPFRFIEETVTNPNYQLSGDLPPVIAPGATVKLTLRYVAQDDPIGAQINFRLSEEVLAGRRNLTFPLQIKFPQAFAPQYTPAQLQQFINQAPPPSLSPEQLQRLRNQK
jgi:hypothetical protein